MGQVHSYYGGYYCFVPLSSSENWWFCDDYGMSLPEPNSAETNQQLVDVANSLSHPSMQLGIMISRDFADSTGNWKYFSSEEDVSDYFNWAPGKPSLPWDDNVHPDWDSAVLRASDGKWEDARRGDSATVICSSYITSGEFHFESLKTDFMFSQSV